MPLLKGKSALWFVIGIPLLVVGTLLYAKSEALSGWANVEKGKTLEVWGAIVFFAGVACWINMLRIGFKRHTP